MQINLKFSSRQTGHQANILEFPRQLFDFSSLTRWTKKTDWYAHLCWIIKTPP